MTVNCPQNSENSEFIHASFYNLREFFYSGSGLIPRSLLRNDFSEFVFNTPQLAAEKFICRILYFTYS